MYVEGYLSETPLIDAEAELSYQTKFKPAVYEGQIAIRAIRPATTHQQSIGGRIARSKR
jgi:hypothetical protein